MLHPPWAALGREQAFDQSELKSAKPSDIRCAQSDLRLSIGRLKLTRALCEHRSAPRREARDATAP